MTAEGLVDWLIKNDVDFNSPITQDELDELTKKAEEKIDESKILNTKQKEAVKKNLGLAIADSDYNIQNLTDDAEEKVKQIRATKIDRRKILDRIGEARTTSELEEITLEIEDVDISSLDKKRRDKVEEIKKEVSESFEEDRRIIKGQKTLRKRLIERREEGIKRLGGFSEEEREKLNIGQIIAIGDLTRQEAWEFKFSGTLPI